MSKHPNGSLAPSKVCVCPGVGRCPVRYCRCTISYCCFYCSVLCVCVIESPLSPRRITPLLTTLITMSTVTMLTTPTLVAHHLTSIIHPVTTPSTRQTGTPPLNQSSPHWTTRPSPRHCFCSTSHTLIRRTLIPQSSCITHLTPTSMWSFILVAHPN